VVGTDLGRPISLELGTDDTGDWVTHAVCANVEYTSLQKVSCELSPGVGDGLHLRVKADNLYSDPFAVGRLRTSYPYLLSYDAPEVFGINVSSKMYTTGNIIFTILGATLDPSLDLNLKLPSLLTGANFGSDLLDLKKNYLNVTIGQQPCQQIQIVSSGELKCAVTGVC
jgi:hypothetical protein